MADLRTEAVPLVDGSSLRLTVAEPDGPTRGGIVVLHEARGVTDTVRRIVSGIAEDGWLTVAPHLYHRDDADEIDAGASAELVADQVGRLDREQIMADTDTAFGWLAERQIGADRMGIVGFDIGGSVALLVAADRVLGAAVTVGGGGISGPLAGVLPALTAAASGLTCPWLGIYGEPDDGAELEALRTAAAKAGVATNVVTYPKLGHRFDTDPEASAEAWQRVLNWFDSHLR